MIRQTIDGVTALDLLETADALTDIQATAYFKELDTAYPNARFVMTVRDETSWLQSMSRHMNECERRRDPYINKMHQRVYRTERFDEAKLKEARAAHEAEVAEHFADRPGKLLVLPILSQAGDESWRQLCEFLGTARPDVPFPHLNQSAETQAPA
ncbi:MAG: sulfotransferase [Planctomycetaceae bacterium]